MLECRTGTPAAAAAKLWLNPDTERSLHEEEGDGEKNAFQGIGQIIEFKSPVDNGSWSRRILSIYLRSHFPSTPPLSSFWGLTMTDYDTAAGVLVGVARNPSQRQLSSTAEVAMPWLDAARRQKQDISQQIGATKGGKNKRTMAALMFRANTNDANTQVSRLLRCDADGCSFKTNSPNLRISARKVGLTLTACLESNMAAPAF